jgi:FAD-linked sulfhydryl oxidase
MVGEVFIPTGPGAWVWKWPNVPKPTWGPLGWNWLHTTAIDYPLDPTPREAAAARLCVQSFAAHLPCGECRRHALAYLAKHPPNLSNTYAFQSWAWQFHNAVNVRLGKRAFTYVEYNKFYERELECAAWKSGKRPRFV